jgi:hypothetical protein
MVHLSEWDGLPRRKNGIFTLRSISGQNSRSTPVLYLLRVRQWLCLLWNRIRDDFQGDTGFAEKYTLQL